MTAIVRKNQFIFDGVHYFRGGALAVQLGEYGRKRTPFLGVPSLEVVDEVPLKRCKIERVENIQIDFTATQEIDFAAEADFAVAGAPGKVSGKAAFSKLKSAELVLTLLTIDLKDLENAINASKPDREELAEIGARGRVASQVFVVTTAQLARELKAAGELTLDITKGNGSARLSSSQKTEVELPKGSTFAYLLANPDFDSSGRVTRLTTDEVGPS